MGEGPIQICMDSDIRELLLGGSQTALNKLSEERFQLVNEQLLNDYDDSLTNDYSVRDKHLFCRDQLPTGLCSTLESERQGTVV